MSVKRINHRVLNDLKVNKVVGKINAGIYAFEVEFTDGTRMIISTSNEKLSYFFYSENSRNDNNPTTSIREG